MVDAICLGELLIDFVSTESMVKLRDAPCFEKKPGGAPANVAVALAKLDIQSGFVGKVGDDEFGYCLKETLEKYGVDTSHLLLSREAKTTLAFVSLAAEGERSFAFYRDPGADMLLKPEEIDRSYIQNARVFHFGSISLISEPSRSATMKALEVALDEGLVVSYDPNLRESLWDSLQQAHQRISSCIDKCHILKVNDEELPFLADTDEPKEGSKRLMEHGMQLVCVTLGARGCVLRNKGSYVEVPATKVKAVDTTGSGDGFDAGIIKGVLDMGISPQDIASLSAEDLRRIGITANAIGALTATRKGAMEGLPNDEDLQKFICTRGQQGTEPAS